MIDSLIKEIKDKYIEYIFVDMDGCVAEFSYKGNVKIDKWYQCGIFENRRPMKSIIDKIEKIKNECDCKIIILSASPNNIANKEKMNWIKENMKFISEDNVILIGNADYKVNTMNEITEGIIDAMSYEEKSNMYKCSKEKSIDFTSYRKIELSLYEIIKKQSLIIEDTHSTLFEAEKNGYNAWHISRLVD